MQLVYGNDTKTVINVTLADGETLGHLAGPVTASVPTDPANTDYARIVAEGIEPEPYVPPPQPKEET